MNVDRPVTALLAVPVISAGAAGTAAVASGNGSENAPDYPDAPAGDGGDARTNVTDDGMNRSEVAAGPEPNRADGVDDSGGSAVLTDDAVPASRSESDPAAGRGLSVDLPARVPAHVERVHRETLGHVGEGVDDLGSAVSDLANGDGEPGAADGVSA